MIQLIEKKSEISKICSEENIDNIRVKVYLHDSTYVEFKWLENWNSSQLNNMHIKIASTIIEFKVSKKLNDV
jgi:hypothetical protein